MGGRDRQAVLLNSFVIYPDDDYFLVIFVLIMTTGLIIHKSAAHSSSVIPPPPSLSLSLSLKFQTRMLFVLFDVLFCFCESEYAYLHWICVVLGCVSVN